VAGVTIFNLVSALGLGVLMALAWTFSTNHRCVNVRGVAWGVALQLVFALAVFRWPVGVKAFGLAGRVVDKMVAAAGEGTRFCFGPLALLPGQEGSPGFILLFQALAVVVFFAAVMQVLYYLRIMPLVLRAFAWVFSRSMRVSGAEALGAAANIFVGIESATTVRPFLKGMTRSELCTILTAGLATIASSMLGTYTAILRDILPDIGAHLISASFLSAPAALVMSKLIVPETGQPETLGLHVRPHVERESNIIEAAMNGAIAGGRLLMGVVVMLLAFLGLLALANMIIQYLGAGIGHLTGWPVSLRLEDGLAYMFYPLTLVIGVPVEDAMAVARLLGERVVITELGAYPHLAELIRTGGLHHTRSAVMAAYALCGFAHIPSVAIFVGGISMLAPNQTRTLSQLALRALAAATLACLMTAAVAGVFYTGQAPLVVR
jgi:CNT family concentrative nucleoside transporter